jgi:hypothetical protein
MKFISPADEKVTREHRSGNPKHASNPAMIGHGHGNMATEHPHKSVAKVLRLPAS